MEQAGETKVVLASTKIFNIFKERKVTCDLVIHQGNHITSKRTGGMLNRTVVTSRED